MAPFVNHSECASFPVEAVRLHEEPKGTVDRDHLVVVRKVGEEGAIKREGDRRLVERGRTCSRRVK